VQKSVLQEGIRRIVEMVFDTVKDTLERGEKIKLSGSQLRRAARKIARRPQPQRARRSRFSARAC